MLDVNDLTFRIEGRTLFDQATVQIADGWTVGFTGRNGTGKSTLFRLIRGEIAPDAGAVSVREGRRLGWVAQEAPATRDSLLDTVLAADTERASLLERAETETDGSALAQIHTRLADIDAYSAEARAATVLAGLGFGHDDQARPCAEFSGGWRMRVALAGVLFARPDLLLLDEPTNYLDLEGAVWLECYLRRYPYTALVISHDRGLLNAAVTHTLALEHGKLAVTPGGYDDYARLRAERARLASAQAANVEAKRAHMQAFVDRFRAKASKARQAQSRLKALEKLGAVEVPAEDRVQPFVFPDPKPRMAPPLVRLAGADLGYGEHVVLRGLDLRVDDDDRIAILGANGEGKSTLVKALAGRRAPLAGNVYRHKKQKVAYFAQHQLDELRPKESPYDHVRTLMPDGTEAEVRSKTAQLGFGPDKADTKVEKLSGGEKARLLFGLMAFDGPQLMILDEPTNHLDIQSRDALIEALNAYAGAVLLITHDAHIAEACADRLWEVRGGAVHRFEGDLSDYRERVLAATRTAPEEKPKAKDGGPSQKDQRRAAADRRRELQPLRNEVRAAEKAMAEAEAEIARIDGALAEPGLFERDLPRATELSQKRARLLEAMAAAEERWLDASGRLEAEEAA